MRRMTWIWFVGFAVWVGDGLVQVHYGELAHAKLAFMVAIVFFAAALFYRRQPR